MSVWDFLDDYGQMVIELLKDHPTGLGQNEMERLLEGKISKNTLKIRLNKLEKLNFIKNTVENWRQGKSKNYIFSEAFNKYEELIEKIIYETEEFIDELSKYDNLSNPIKLKNFKRLCNKIRLFYSISNVMDVVGSWNFAWTSDSESMAKILLLLYVSFNRVNSVSSIIVINNLDILNKDIREIVRQLEKKYPDKMDYLDYEDLKYLNIFNIQTQQLDKLYQDIIINNESEKKD